MSNIFQKQKMSNNKSPQTKINSSKRVKSQKKYLKSPDIITQISKQNYNLNLDINYLHQQCLTPINNRKKLYEDQYLIPEKSSKFEGKKTLVLDIDETLVHSSFFPFEKNDLILNVNFDGIFYNIYVLVRPGVEEFIQNISKYYEIITFTASLSAYAKPLLDIIDKGRNIQYRLYREHCTFINGVFIKDLKRLNRNLKDIIIVDNSPMAFAFDTDNGLPILSWFDDPIDKELINIQPLLEFLADTKDVRKYIKQFVKNNIINYEKAHKIINEAKNAQSNLIENESTNNNKENEVEKTDNIYINNNKKKEKLLNNFIMIKSRPKKSALIKGDNNIKNFDINNINNINNEQTITPKFKLDFENLEDINKNNNESIKYNSVREKHNKNNAKLLCKKNNVFRLGIKINDNNNIMQFNNFNPQYLYNKNCPGLELDYKTKENLLMPMIFSHSINTTKNKNYQIQYNNKKDNSEKTNNKQINFFPKNKNYKNSNVNNLQYIQQLSPKVTLDEKLSSVKQIKYINLNDKIQDNKVKSSSLKMIDNKKNDLKLKTNTIINSGENNMINYKYKLKNYNINNINLKEQLKKTKQKMNELLNKDLDCNNNINKINDILLQSIRSKSTGNFVKLKSAHAITAKNSYMKDNKNINLRWFKNEEKKKHCSNNENYYLIERISINGKSEKKI